VGERWVVDASPLIALSKVGHAGWMVDLAAEVVVPAAVAAEVWAGPPDLAQRFLAGGRVTIVPVPQTTAEVADWALGAGESAALTWAATHPGWTVIVDDLPARRCARALGLAHKGTLAVVILAKLHGLTGSAAAVLHDLRQVGLRLDDAVIRAALAATVDEDWPLRR